MTRRGWPPALSRNYTHTRAGRHRIGKPTHPSPRTGPGNFGSAVRCHCKVVAFNYATHKRGGRVSHEYVVGIKFGNIGTYIGALYSSSENRKCDRRRCGTNAQIRCAIYFSCFSVLSAHSIATYINYILLTVRMPHTFPIA